MRWIVTFNDLTRYEKDDSSPLRDKAVIKRWSDITWLSLRYGGVQYNFKYPECIVAIDSGGFVPIDVRPTVDVIPVIFYRARSVLGMNATNISRSGNLVFMAVGARGRTDDGHDLETCLRVYPDGRTSIFVARTIVFSMTPMETTSTFAR